MVFADLRMGVNRTCFSSAASFRGFVLANHRQPRSAYHHRRLIFNLTAKDAYGGTVAVRGPDAQSIFAVARLFPLDSARHIAEFIHSRGAYRIHPASVFRTSRGD